MKLFLNRALLVFLLLAAACSTTRDEHAGQQEDLDQTAIAQTHAWLQDFGTKYKYDVGYMEALLELSPAAYHSFAAGMGMAEHRVDLPIDAHYVGILSALRADDCGQCTQLNLRLAAEAGVDRDLLRQVLEAPDQLPLPLRTVYDYASQVVRGENADADCVTRLRQVYGDKAFAELAVNVLGARIYPALRRALGAEQSCPPPNLDF